MSYGNNQNKQYDNNNRGGLFVNDRKQKPTQPDFKGKITVGGVEYYVSCWDQTKKPDYKQNQPIFDLSFTPVNEAQRPQGNQGGGYNQAPVNQGNSGYSNQGGGYGQGNNSPF